MRRGLRGDSRNCFAGLRVSVLCAVCRCGRNGQLRSSGLARYLKAAGIEVMEVERPKRRHLRRNGKGRTPSMRRLLLGRSWPTTRPENPRALMVSGGDDPDLEIGPSIGAEGPCTQAANQLQALLVSAPEGLRHRAQRELPTKSLVDTCARFRPGASPNDVQTATKFALRRRWHGATSSSAKKSPNSMSTWIGWWRMRPRS